MEHLPLGPPITIKPIVLRSIAVFLASLILIPTLLLVLRPGTADAWFDDSYAYRQKITFTHNANLTNASMRLTVSNTDTLVSDGKMQGDCDDTRFTDSNGKTLRFKLVSGCNSASTVYDVLFPTVINGSNLAYFYYGNPSAVSASDSSVPDGTVPSGAPSFGSEEKGPSPALYLRFDEGYGATTQDTTSNNNDGAVSGAAWKTKDLCLFDNCLFFDGTDDVVTVTNADSLDMDRALAAGLTYQAWVRVNSDGEGSVGQIFNKGTNTYLRITNEGADGTADVEASLALATSNATTTLTDGIKLNTWTHIAVAYTDDGDDEITVYINGVQKGASTNGSGAPAADANNLLIGGPTTANFHGFLDEFKVYPVERTSEQIKTDTTKATSLHGVSASFGDDQSFISEGLVGYWKFDESSGNAADSSGNGVTLTNNDSTNFTGGKFGNSGWFNAASSDHFSAAATINNINTVSFWASPSATTDEFINLTASARITASSGTVSFTGATAPAVYVNGVLNGTITADAWNHIVVVTTTPITADTFEVGRANSAYTNGKIDDVRLYNRSLTPSEIERLYDWGPGPVGWWKLDERTGTTVYDSSGNNNTGTLTNGPQWTTGKLGQALDFDGVNDQVDLAANAIDNRTEFTLSLWFKTKSTVLGHLYMEFDQSGSQRNVTIQIEDGQIGFVWRGVASGWCSSGNSTLYNDGQWHHAVGVVNNGTAILYIDGAFIDSSTCSFQSINADIKGFGLVGAWGGRWQGSIDDVRVYNYPLTPKQIVSVMNADHPAVGSPVGSAIGHWKFDEGFGTKANNSGSAGSVLNGTLTSMDSPATYGSGWTDHGKFGKALNFDGINDYVDAGAGTNLDVGTGDYAVNAWIKARDTANWAIISASGGNLPEEDGIWFSIHPNTGILEVWVSDGTSFVVDGFAGTTDLRDDQWHHVTWVWDRDVGNKFYIDGVLEASDTTTNSADILSDQNFTIGGRPGGNPFLGRLDDIRVYNYALTPDEVKVVYNQGKAIVLGSLSTNPDGITASNSAARAYCPPGDTTTCNPPVGHWTFDERQGTTANDVTGNANTGTLTNDPKWEKGKLGQALEFDGVDDCVLVPDNTLWDFAGKDATVSLWMRADSSGSGGDLVIDHFSGGSPGTGWSFQLNSSNFLFFEHRGTNSLFVNNTSQNWRDGQWHHLVGVVHDATADMGEFYIDGQLYGTDTFSGLIDNDQDLGIGAINTCTSVLKGTIDDVRVYNYARTPAQIAWEYNRGAPIAHYEFDTCSGTIAYDESDNRYNGTINPVSSGNTAAGTCGSGTATEMWNDGTSGKFNASLGFDGTDDYVQISDTANLRFDESSKDFSLFAWVKRTTTGTEYVLSKEDADDDGWRLMLNASDQVVCGQDATDVTSTTAITDTNWHLIGCTIDRDGNGQVYIDGIANGSTAAMGTDAMATTANIRIGTRSYTSISYFNGLIDDVRLYNYILTPAQIRTVYNQNSAVRFGPLTGSP